MSDETKPEVIETEAIVTFVRRYIPCDCGGWSERYDGVNVLSREIRTARVSPTSVTVPGRENHVRSCSKTPAGATS